MAERWAGATARNRALCSHHRHSEALNHKSEGRNDHHEHDPQRGHGHIIYAEGAQNQQSRNFRWTAAPCNAQVASNQVCPSVLLPPVMVMRVTGVGVICPLFRSGAQWRATSRGTVRAGRPGSTVRQVPMGTVFQTGNPRSVGSEATETPPSRWR